MIGPELRQSIRSIQPAATTNRHLQRFARAHLRSAAELAAYETLVLAPDRQWTSDDLSAAARIEAGEADVVLRRLADAGAVDQISGSERRYRWSPSMEYLFTPAPSAAAPTDPFCGMTVHDHRYRVLEDGAEVRFCSLRCQSLYNRRQLLARRQRKSLPSYTP